MFDRKCPLCESTLYDVELRNGNRVVVENPVGVVVGVLTGRRTMRATCMNGCSIQASELEKTAEILLKDGRKLSCLVD